MFRLSERLLLVTSLFFSLVQPVKSESPQASDNKPPKDKKQGRTDQLPIGALARLDTMGSRHRVFSSAFSPDGKLLATAGDDGMVRVWKVDSGKEVRRFPGHAGFAYCVAFSPNGMLLASGDLKAVHLWDATTGKHLRTLTGFDGGRNFRVVNGLVVGILSLAFSPDGKVLGASEGDLSIRFWEVATGKELSRFPGPGRVIKAMAFLPDGMSIATASEGGAIHLWDTANGKEISKIRDEHGVLNSPCFALSPDGRMLACGSGRPIAPGGRLVRVEGTVSLWELATGKERRRLEVPAAVLGIALSPDGKTLAYTRGNVVHILEVASWKEVKLIKGEGNSVQSVAYSPDGTKLITGGFETSILVWDVAGDVARPKRSDAGLPPRDLDALWTDLAGEDAAKAYQAIWVLAAGSRQTMAFFEKRLRPISSPSPQQINNLVTDLDNPQFTVREKATKELAKLGDLAAPALEKVLKTGPTIEVRRRVERLLEELAGPVTSSERLQALRAIEVIEHIGSAEAQQLLAKLALGAPEAKLTQEAKASLDRLVKQATKMP